MCDCPRLQPVLTGVEIQAPVFEIQAPVFEIQAPVFEIQAPVFEIQAPGFEIQAPGFEIQAPGFEIQAPLWRGVTGVGMTEWVLRNIFISALNQLYYQSGGLVFPE